MRMCVYTLVLTVIIYCDANARMFYEKCMCMHVRSNNIVMYICCYFKLSMTLTCQPPAQAMHVGLKHCRHSHVSTANAHTLYDFRVLKVEIFCTQFDPSKILEIILLNFF